MRTSRTPTRRGGFTLVELLVAAALTVLIMAVLATAFQAGMSTLSHLKSVVGLSEQLRAAETIIRRDLESQHLEAEDGMAVRVSDPRLKTTAWLAPGKGYFEATQGSQLLQNYDSSPTGLANYVGPVPGPALVVSGPNAWTHIQEGREDGVLSVRAVDHRLYFTSKLRANAPEEVFIGDAPSQVLAQTLIDFRPAGAGGNTFVSEWAEIAYFLSRSGLLSVSDDPGAPPLVLYTLHRRQRSLARSATSLPLLPAAGGLTNSSDWWTAFPEASISTQPAASPPVPPPQQAGVNDPTSVSAPRNRSNVVFDAAGVPTITATPTTGAKQGTDILLSNVVSMQIRVMLDSGVYVDELPGGIPTAGNPRRLDTATAVPVGGGGSKPQIRAVQLKLRIYDTKNHLTRQLTIAVDL